MAQPYDLTQLDTTAFEHMVNFLAMKKLGSGVTGFASGPDAGRDGYLKGRASYPTENECWEGIWYIQSKFHKPHLSKDEQKWLISEVKKEINSFLEEGKRSLPDIWIIATNIEPSGHHKTGSFDTISTLAKEEFPNLKVEVWGGKRILDFLMEYPEVAVTYGHFLTPGHIISKLYLELNNKQNTIKSIINHLIAHQFKELCTTKLEQAGSNSDQRQKIFEIFRDLPMFSREASQEKFIMNSLVSTAKNVHKISTWSSYGSGWREWSILPQRARIIVLKGGPGQGKSTAGQYFAQIQKACFILSEAGPIVTPPVRALASELKAAAEIHGYWPSVPRIPVLIELKEYAKWYIDQAEHDAKNILQFIYNKILLKSSFDFRPSMIREALSFHSWFINFDGLDEVPNDIKDKISAEIIEFSEETTAQIDSDVLILCTTRPQGYSGQFDSLTACVCNLLPLPQDIALDCASAVIKYNRTEDEAEDAIGILELAMRSPQVKDLMTTPLQAHIMAVVVRDGGRPPERRWELFNNFYNVMKKREGLKNFLDKKISALLQENDQLLKAIHDRLGICLHAKAELSTGAESALNKEEFKTLSEETVEKYLDINTNEIVDTLMRATIERLVFVNTPESSDHVRFDVRQLQEFFAGEFIHSAVNDEEFKRRFELICGDAHWREVVHFVLSALAQSKKLSTLAISSAILQQLDNHDDDYKLRTFKKRLGVGSILTLRLLEEGVLEQDKGIRYHFNNNLHPLWNILEQNIIARVISIQKEQSLNWIVNNLIGSFIEFDYTEHIVAGHYISILLKDDHPRFKEVILRLIHAPIYYWEAIFSLYEREPFMERPMLPKAQQWFVKLVAQQYLSKQNKNTKLLTSMHYFLLANSSLILEVVSGADFSEEESYILTYIFKTTEMRYHEDDRDSDDNYCFVSAVHHKVSWKTGYLKEDLAFDLTYNVHSYPVELTKAALRYTATFETNDFLKLLKLIQDNNYVTNFMPSQLKAKIPLRFDPEFIENQVSHLLTIPFSDVKIFLSDKILEKDELFLECQHISLTSSEFSKEKWNKLCNDYPLLALRIPLNQFFNREEVDYAIKNYPLDFYKPLLNIALKDIATFSKAFFLWGDIFKAFPSHEKELRNKLSCTLPSEGLSLFHPMSRNHHFNINIEQEKVFLIYMSLALFKDQGSSNFSSFDPSTLLGLRYNEEYLMKFGVSNRDLLSLIASKAESNLLRASCISLYISQKHNKKDLNTDDFFDYGFDSVILSILTNETYDILSVSLVFFLRDITQFDERLMSFLGEFSNITKENFESRMLIQSIYEKWRERSFPVVNDARVLKSWLNYSY